MASRICDASGTTCVSLPLSAAPLSGIWATGYVARFTGTNTLGTGALQDNGTNVGIGTAPTTVSLTIGGDLRSASNPGSIRTWWAFHNSNTTLVLQGGALSGVGGNIELGSNAINAYDANTHLFRNLDQTSEYARIGSDGNLAVGTTTTSAAKLTINAGTQNALNIQTANASPWALTLRNATATQRGLDMYQDNTGNSYIYNAFGTANQGTLFFAANGNISIGNTTAGQKLDVTGNIKASGQLWGTHVCNASGAWCATATEMSYLAGTTSAVQAQLNGKQPTITGAATTLTTANLAINSALIADTAGKVAVSPTVSATELGYLDGVTSPLQTQLNAKAAVASPVFTGDPTAPTPATADNDASIATTAFVKAQGYLSTLSETDPKVGSLTNFALPRWLGTSLASSQVYDDGARVGIGTTSPAHKLDVAGNARVNDSLYFVNTQRLRGDGSSVLFYQSNHSTVTQQLFQDLEGTQYGRIYGDTDGANFGLLDGDAQWSYRMQKDSHHEWYVNNVSKGLLSNESMLLWTQQVAVGWNRTGNRFAYLDLIGDDTYTAFGLRLLRSNTGPNADSWLQHRGTGAFRIYAQEAAPIVLTTSNAERMRIDANGNVGIGIAAPTSRLHVAGGAIGGNYGLTPSYAAWNTYGTGDGGAAIYSDNGAYKQLMIVGNNSAGGSRIVGVWDKLNVHGNVEVYWSWIKTTCIWNCF
jgi:hypothetical protein